jgi:hypothetical protein
VNEQLLRPLLLKTESEDHARLFRLAAMEAEAIAWQTPYPHLFYLALLEEKLEAARRYVVCQALLREKSRNWLEVVSGSEPVAPLRDGLPKIEPARLSYPYSLPIRIPLSWHYCGWTARAVAHRAATC